MAGFDDSLGREYFEVNGFFVRQSRKYAVQSRRKRADEEGDLLVINPAPRREMTLPFQLFGSDIPGLTSAVVAIKAWHTTKAITPTTGLVTIESDLQQADNSTGVVTATGNVRIVYPDQRVVATARQAQYFSKEGRVVLSGDVDIVQEGGNLLRAEQVVYLVDSERLTAIPPQGQQVFSRLRMQQTAPATAQPAASQSSAPQPAPVAPVRPLP